MKTIIAQPGQDAHPNPDQAAQQRADQLARTTADQMESALAYLSMIDPEAFEIAFTAVTQDVDEIPQDDEAIPPVPPVRQPGRDLPQSRPALAALPRGRCHVRRPGDLRPGTCRRGRLDPPRREPGRPLVGHVPAQRSAGLPAGRCVCVRTRSCIGGWSCAGNREWTDVCGEPPVPQRGSPARSVAILVPSGAGSADLGRALPGPEPRRITAENEIPNVVSAGHPADDRDDADAGRLVPRGAGEVLGQARAGEQTLLKRLVKRRPDLFAGRITCFDRNLPGHELITAILDAGGHVIARLKTHPHPPRPNHRVSLRVSLPPRFRGAITSVPAAFE